MLELRKFAMYVSQWEKQIMIRYPLETLYYASTTYLKILFLETLTLPSNIIKHFKIHFYIQKLY